MKDFWRCGLDWKTRVSALRAIRQEEKTHGRCDIVQMPFTWGGGVGFGW